MKTRSLCIGGSAAIVLAFSIASPAAAQDSIGATSLTIYSTTQPGSVSPDLYRPVPGQGNAYTGQAVPGYAMIRQERALDLTRGVNRLNFRDVAAYIDTTKVAFEYMTETDAAAVKGQNFRFVLVRDV